MLASAPNFLESKPEPRPHVVVDTINARLVCRVCGGEEPLKPCRESKDLAAFDRQYQMFKAAHQHQGGGGCGHA